MASRVVVPLLALLLTASAVPGAVGGPAGGGEGATGSRVGGVREIAVFTDPAITESSGLVVRRGRLVTVNDSGDSGRVFTVGKDGATVGVTSWARTPTDVEALAPAGRGRVWVADVGDNARARSEITVLRVKVGARDRRARPRRYVLRLPDGPVDIETLMVRPRNGRLVLVTKEPTGGRFLLAPRTLRPGRPNRLSYVGGAAPAVATDGAFFPDGRHVVVRTYTHAVVYTWPARRLVGRFALPAQQQGEGIAVGNNGRVYVSSEGTNAPVLRVGLPRWLVRAMRP